MSNFPLPYDTTKLTVELRNLVESGVKLWDFEYDSYYKGSEKTAFEQKVIDHYYFRQIGSETPARFLHKFRTRVREVMPYYIQLYKSVELMESVGDPFQAYDLTEEFTRQHSGTGKTTTTTQGENSSTTTESVDRLETFDAEGEVKNNGTTDNTRKFSNTPQGSINNIDNYLTEATKENGSTGSTETRTGAETRTGSDERESSAELTVSESSEGTSEDSGTESYKLTRKGNIGVQPLGTEILAYRAALTNVDELLIKEFNDLFIMVY